VRYAVAAVSARIAKDPALAAEVGKLIATCRGAPA